MNAPMIAMKGSAVKNIMLGMVGIIAVASAQAATISNMQLNVDGQPFFVRGMVYSPESRAFPGNSIKSSSQYGWQYGKGGWLCMAANQYAVGDWQSPCNDDDAFGLLTINTDANNQYNAALKSQWQFDLDDMQKMGVNTLRLYNVNPTGKRHTDFLDAANSRGMKVIYPVLTDYLSKSYDDSQVRSLIRETCQHPAILAYTVGNEFDVDLLNDPNGIRAQAVRKAADAVRQECPAALVTYAAVDDPSKWALGSDGKSRLMEFLGNRVDFLTVNAGYRGDPSTPANSYDALYNQVTALTQAYQKPFLIGEVGVHDQDDHLYNRRWFNWFWKKALERSTAANNLGAVFFEYGDEPIKKSVAGVSNDMFMGLTTAAWPTASPDRVTAIANLPKTASYAGIPTYADSGTNITWPNSAVGAGRYEMFVQSIPQGIEWCSYAHSPGPGRVAAGCSAN